MNKLRNSVIVFLAIVGICGVIFIAWQIYEQKRAAEQFNRSIPNDIFKKNSPPPLQP
jgi:hypothetical protein